MVQIRNRLGALACAAALSLAGAAQAATYDLSYTFGVDGTGTVNTVTGTVDGTLNGAFLEDLHDFKLSYDGHAFTGALSAMTWDPASESFTADAPRLAFDLTQNELVITNDDGSFSFGLVTDVGAYGGQLVFAGDANLVEHNAVSELVGAAGSGTFTLSAVPESSDLALMLAGLGVVGIAARRRRAQ
ncbi:MAG: FxDxF family PEP-CTERM protein [Vitreoscilla sp.]